MVNKLSLSIVFALLVFVSEVKANADVFARQGDMVITQSEMDAAFAQIPADVRLRFIRDGEKVNQLVQTLFRTKQMAEAAKDSGFDKKELISDRLVLAAEKELSAAWLQHVMENIPEADYEALAEEQYLVSPEAYTTALTLDVSHILISSDTRPDELALEMATDLHEKLMEDPSQFDAFVMEYSEDPAKASNRGRYAQMQRGQMVKPFEDMAFALNSPGQISELVKTSYGFHILRLNERNEPDILPFEDVKGALMAEAEKKYLADYKRRYVIGLSHEPIELPEGSVQVMLERYFGENLELAPEFQE